MGAHPRGILREVRIGSVGCLRADEEIVADADEQVGVVLDAVHDDGDLKRLGLTVAGDGRRELHERVCDVIGSEQLLTRV